MVSAVRTLFLLAGSSLVVSGSSSRGNQRRGNHRGSSHRPNLSTPELMIPMMPVPPPVQLVAMPMMPVPVLVPGLDAGVVIPKDPNSARLQVVPYDDGSLWLMDTLTGRMYPSADASVQGEFVSKPVPEGISDFSRVLAAGVFGTATTQSGMFGGARAFIYNNRDHNLWVQFQLDSIVPTALGFTWQYRFPLANEYVLFRDDNTVIAFVSPALVQLAADLETHLKSYGRLSPTSKISVTLVYTVCRPGFVLTIDEIDEDGVVLAFSMKLLYISATSPEIPVVLKEYQAQCAEGNAEGAAASAAAPAAEVKAPAAPAPAAEVKAAPAPAPSAEVKAAPAPAAEVKAAPAPAAEVKAAPAPAAEVKAAPAPAAEAKAASVPAAEAKSASVPAAEAKAASVPAPAAKVKAAPAAAAEVKAASAPAAEVKTKKPKVKASASAAGVKAASAAEVKAAPAAAAVAEVTAAPAPAAQVEAAPAPAAVAAAAELKTTAVQSLEEAVCSMLFGSPVLVDGAIPTGAFSFAGAGHVALPAKEGKWPQKPLRSIAMDVASVNGALKASLSVSTQDVTLSMKDIAIVAIEDGSILLNVCEIAEALQQSQHDHTRRTFGAANALRYFVVKLARGVDEFALEVSITAVSKTAGVPDRIVLSASLAAQRPVTVSAAVKLPEEEKKTVSAPAPAPAPAPAAKKIAEPEKKKAAPKKKKAVAAASAVDDEDAIFQEFQLNSKASRFPVGAFRASGKLQLATGGKKGASVQTMHVTALFPEASKDGSASVDVTLFVAVETDSNRVYRRSNPIPAVLGRDKTVQLDGEKTEAFFRAVFAEKASQSQAGPAKTGFEALKAAGLVSLLVFDEAKNSLNLTLTSAAKTTAFKADLTAAATAADVEAAELAPGQTLSADGRIGGGVFAMVEYAPSERLSETEKYDEAKLRVELEFSATERLVDIFVSFGIPAEVEGEEREMFMWFADKNFEYRLVDEHSIEIVDQQKLKTMFQQDAILRQLLVKNRNLSLKLTHSFPLAGHAASKETIVCELISQDAEKIYAPTPVFAALLAVNSAPVSAVHSPTVQSRFEGVGVVAEEVRPLMDRVSSVLVTTSSTGTLNLSMTIVDVGTLALDNVAYSIVDQSSKTKYAQVVLHNVDSLLRAQLPLFAGAEVASLTLSVIFDFVENAFVCNLRVLKADGLDARHVQTAIAVNKNK